MPGPGFPDGTAAKGAAAAAIVNRVLCRQADAKVAPLILELRGGVGACGPSPAS